MGEQQKEDSRGSGSAIGFTRDGFLLRLTFAGDVGALEKGLDAEMLRALRPFRRDPREKPLVTFVGAGNSREE